VAGVARAIAVTVGAGPGCPPSRRPPKAPGRRRGARSTSPCPSPSPGHPRTPGSLAGSLVKPLWPWSPPSGRGRVAPGPDGPTGHATGGRLGAYTARRPGVLLAPQALPPLTPGHIVDGAAGARPGLPRADGPAAIRASYTPTHAAAYPEPRRRGSYLPARAQGSPVGRVGPGVGLSVEPPRSASGRRTRAPLPVGRGPGPPRPDALGTPAPGHRPAPASPPDAAATAAKEKFGPSGTRRRGRRASGAAPPPLTRTPPYPMGS